MPVEVLQLAPRSERVKALWAKLEIVIVILALVLPPFVIFRAFESHQLLKTYI
jgi:hypothetical protein